MIVAGRIALITRLHVGSDQNCRNSAAAIGKIVSRFVESDYQEAALLKGAGGEQWSNVALQPLVRSLKAAAQRTSGRATVGATVGVILDIRDDECIIRERT